MGKAKPFFHVQYKYPNEPWIDYDKTQDPGWRDVQSDRVVRDHPGAEYRVETK